MALTARSQYKLHFEYEGNRLRIDLTRELFEELTHDLVERTLFTVRKMLKDASRTWPDITSILLVGGSTRMPMIIESLETESGVVINRSISPDEAVAHGSAIYADVLLSKDSATPSEMLVKNVNSHYLGVLAVEGSTGLPRRKILIPRNSSLPATGSGAFKTRDENQQTVAVNVIEGGDASGRNATKIGTCVVSGLPGDLPAKTSVEVRFQYLENGRLTVEAWLPETKSQAMLEIERAAGLSGEKMDSWREWLEAGAILSASEQEIAPEEDEAESSEELSDFSDEDEESATASEFDFEAIDEEESEEEKSENVEEFDFNSLEEESGSNDEASDCPVPDSDNEEDPSDMFDGIDAGDEEEKGTVGTDDSDLADFFRDQQ